MLRFASNPRANQVAGTYVKEHDPNGHGGIGTLVLTWDIASARQFQSFADAKAAWAAQSTIKPLREDGKPNRPLTAYTVDIINLEVESDG